MRVRMLNRSKTIDALNRDFSSVAINVTDQGFPDDVPALKLWGDAFARLAWSHMSFAILVVIDPEGERVLGHSTCQLFRRASQGAFRKEWSLLGESKERFRVLEGLKRDLVSADSGNARADLVRFDAVTDRRIDEILPCLFDDRLVTARYLVSNRWPMVLDVLKPRPDGSPRLVEPCVLPMAIRALGEFLIDDRPFAKEAEAHLREVEWALRNRAWVQKPGQSLQIKRREKEIPLLREEVFAILKQRCAAAIALFLGLDWDPEDPRFVEIATEWWEEHKSDPKFETARAPTLGIGVDPATGKAEYDGSVGWLAKVEHRADDPVNGIRWSTSLEEAMNRAREEEKPVFLAFSVRRLANPNSPYL